MVFNNNSFKSGAASFVASLLFFMFAAHAAGAQGLLNKGMWTGVLKLNDTTDLTFDFDIKETKGKYSSLDIINAEERIAVTGVIVNDDSVFIKMPVFDSEFRCSRKSANEISGVWINHARKDKNVIAFTAFYNIKGAGSEEVFPSNNYFSMQGKWECEFSPGTKDAYKAIGLIKQIDPHKVITGTFLTETGDYRYLQGHLNNNKTFSLSCFDGAHAFLFTGKYAGDSIENGRFYSGSSWSEPWTATRNDKFELRNPDSLTYLKPGFTTVDFSFKNTEGHDVSIKDEKFKNKVVIVQLMGTWCPNCMDETKFLAPFYNTYKKQGLEVVAMAFERTNDFNKAVGNIKRTKERFDANYEFLITMKTGKDQASEALPMLNGIMAFPTTIYIDKKGNVRKIYTGFNGPATGDAYARYVEETTRFVEKLLKE